jgi:hypothetical protein
MEEWAHPLVTDSAMMSSQNGCPVGFTIQILSTVVGLRIGSVRVNPTT